MVRQELAMIRERDFKNDFNFGILELTHHNRVFNMGKAYFGWDKGFFDYIKILNEAFQLLVIDIIEDEEDPHYFCFDIDSHWDFEEGFLWGMYPIHDNMCKMD
jgi:hypothetical protein